MYQEGHEVGNHSYTHEPLVFKSVAFIPEEIEKQLRLVDNLATKVLYILEPLMEENSLASIDVI